jgi:hypothetical protein
MIKMLIIRNNNGNIQYSYLDKKCNTSPSLLELNLVAPPKIKNPNVLPIDLWYNLHKNKINEIVDYYVDKLSNMHVNSPHTYNVVFNEHIFRHNMIILLYQTSQSKCKNFVI